MVCLTTRRRANLRRVCLSLELNPVLLIEYAQRKKRYLFFFEFFHCFGFILMYIILKKMTNSVRKRKLMKKKLLLKMTKRQRKKPRKRRRKPKKKQRKRQRSRKRRRRARRRTKTPLPIRLLRPPKKTKVACPTQTTFSAIQVDISFHLISFHFAKVFISTQS